MKELLSSGEAFWRAARISAVPCMGGQLGVLVAFNPPGGQLVWKELFSVTLLYRFSSLPQHPDQVTQPPAIAHVSRSLPSPDRTGDKDRVRTRIVGFICMLGQ